MMDSFTLYFDTPLSDSDICQALQSSGFPSVVQRPRELAVSSGEAYIWISVDDLDDLNGPDFEDAQDVPMPLHEIQTMLTITMRCNNESEKLGVMIAANLVRTHHAMITWDGMGYWEDLYRKCASEI